MAFLDETGVAELWSCVDDKFGRIEHGSYDGTNTYGQSNPSSLTFGFVPKLVIINSRLVNPTTVPLVYIYGSGVGPNNNYLSFTLNGTTLSWYSTSSADRQKNASGNYEYIAFG